MKTLYNLSEASRKLNLGIGRNKMLEILELKGVINRLNIPQEEYLTNGYFVCKHLNKFNSGYKKTYTMLLVTDKGVDWLSNFLTEYRN